MNSRKVCRVILVPDKIVKSVPLVIALNPSFGKDLRFSCTRCGACCNHIGVGVGLRDKDLARLDDRVQKEIVRHPVFSEVIQSSTDGVCSALSGSVDCTIYSRRPMVCRLYPFYFSIGGDGSIQVSVDHCPGVNQAGDAIDQAYISQQIHPLLIEDPEFILKLKKEVLACKGESYAPTSEGNVRLDWGARKILWNILLEIVIRNCGGDFSPRDSLEVLKSDVIPFVERSLDLSYADDVLREKDIAEFFSRNEFAIVSIILDSTKIQKLHRIEIQRVGRIVSLDGFGNSADEVTTFRSRIGQSFSVSSRDLMKMRPMDCDAISAELDYLTEVVQREFVYSGVIVKPLTLAQESSLLFYLADAIELRANALAIQEGADALDSGLVNLSICEVDASVLTTVRALGGELAISWEVEDDGNQQ